MLSHSKRMLRLRVFWSNVLRVHLLHERLLYFTSSLAAKGLAVRGARRVDIKESVAALEAGESPPMRLKSIHDSLRIMRPPVGKSSWDVIQETTAVSCGQRWSEEDVIAIYNFAKVVGEAHLEFLTEGACWQGLNSRPRRSRQSRNRQTRARARVQ